MSKQSINLSQKETKAVINTIFGRYRESYAHKYPGIVFKNFGLLKYGEAQ